MAASNRRFDPDSGLTYTESEVHRTKIRGHWTWPTTETFAKFKCARKTGEGARSLRETALRAVGIHMTGLSPESFKHVPWTFANDIWRLLQRK